MSTEHSEMERQILDLIGATADRRLPRSELWAKLGIRNAPLDAYYAAEQALVDMGRIERRRGRNGGIYLLPEPEVDAISGNEETRQEAALVDRETDHYKPVLDQILRHWKEQPGFKAVFGAVTGLQGRRATGGRWSRPDIIICTVSEWLFSSRPEGEVRSIEVKRYDALDVMAVYEAVSHKTRSHYAYLLVVGFPEDLTEDQEKDFDTVLAVAGKNGIGVITAGESGDWGTWKFQLYPTRSDADHQEVNQLLLDQVPKEVRDDFTREIRNIQISVSF